MDTIDLAFWAYDMADVPSSLDDLAARIDARMADARREGAAILVIPEWQLEQSLVWAPPGLKPTEEPAFMAEQGRSLLERIRHLPAKHDMALLAGTWSAPAEDGPGLVNRAYLLFPEGHLHTQDKLCLVPSEKDPADWGLTTGRKVGVVTWRGLRIAVLICLDSELPAVSVALGRADIDLLLIPSNTARRSGYHRVFSCAKARAVELGTCVGAVSCVGPVPLDPPRTNHGGAAVFLPCEEALGSDGIHAFLEPRGDGGGVLIAKNVPVGEVRRRRREGFEVWPGPWSGDGLTLTDAGRVA